MHQLHLLGPLTFLVSALLLGATELPWRDTGFVAPTLPAVVTLMLLAVWRGGPAWLRSVSLVPTTAHRVTIRIRCNR
jgi:hypothetical protein